MRLHTFRAGKRWLLPVVLLMLSATGGCKQGAWTLWNAYATRFIDDQGRVFDPKAAISAPRSEGEAYAMFFALADNDRAHFDRILNWTQANLAKPTISDTNLPSWLWGKDKDGTWRPLDPNSASDADVWMAYTLLEAGRLWNVPSYTGLGNGMLNHIAATEVADLPGFGLMLLPGGQGFLHQRPTPVRHRESSCNRRLGPRVAKPRKTKSIKTNRTKRSRTTCLRRQARPRQPRPTC